MKAAAEADGIPAKLLTIASGYRDVATQRRKWESAAKKYPDPEMRDNYIARPGRSPHHSGRAIDFWMGKGIASENIPALRSTGAYKWLVCNAGRFGFTPYGREPWHWEYNPPGFDPSRSSHASVASTAPPVSRPGGPLGLLLQQIRDALGTGRASLAVMLAIQRGIRDENDLTNTIFFARHPERGERKLSRGEPQFEQLSKEWLDIRDRVIGPALQTLPSGTQATLTVPSPAAPAATVDADLPTGPFGTLTVQLPGRSAFAYPFTPEDVVWAAKFIRGEAGGQDDANSCAVMWAMFNKFALLFHKRFRTFADFLRAYSTTLQPHLVNPDAVYRSIEYSRENPGKFKWVQSGTFTYQGKNPKYRGKEIPKGQLQHHLDLQRARWSQLNPKVRALAEGLFKGRVENPIGIASDFANTLAFLRRKVKKEGRDPKSVTVQEWKNYTRDHASRNNRTWIEDRPGLDQMRKNAFFVDRRFVGLPANAVRVIGPSGS